ncbi:hypothetical protein LIER_42151 [Lithospermum erythrorhizon]|uniref:Uncharacterized protein n=1 Tax=Lithospermum erythrorhizon TaxID=34254 RepID=A0AAV3RLZ7_LITER
MRRTVARESVRQLQEKHSISNVDVMHTPFDDENDNDADDLEFFPCVIPNCSSNVPPTQIF